MAVEDLIPIAIDIRDTNTSNKNTNVRIGDFCLSVIDYIGGSGEEYERLIALSNTIRNTSAKDGNTASRMADWCLGVLDLYGFKLEKAEAYRQLQIKARIIGREWRDGENTRRLGAWFVEYLYYIDYKLVYEYLTYRLEIPANYVGQNITLNVGAFSGTVVWGDSEQEQIYSNESPMHVYTQEGSYIVTINGNCRHLQNFYGNFNFVLREVISWGNISPTDEMNNGFFFCSNLERIPDEAPELLFSNFNGDLSNFFTACRSLESIPDDFFKSIGTNTNATEIHFVNTFSSSGIKSISGNIFSGFAERVNILESCFYSSQITTIPDSLFEGVGTNFDHIIIDGIFQNCLNITQIPATLFDPIKDKLFSYNYVFSQCIGIDSFPNTLFQNTKAPSTILSFSYTFANSGITSIPNNIFLGCDITESEEYPDSGINLEGMFSYCENLTTISENAINDTKKLIDVGNMFHACSTLSSIPNLIFDGENNISIFTACFEGCIEATGQTPKGSDNIELWERAGKEGYPELIEGDQCFTFCDKLTNLSDIPFPWNGNANNE